MIIGNKYCKFCEKEKPLEEFAKSGSFIKNICRQCNNKKQRAIYSDSKKTNIYKQALSKIRECCENDSFEVSTKEWGNLVVINCDDILQIIDEVGGSDE
ncbi:MAG: hypothetical protein K2M17_03375 [Bacilli bacterium]|nr:hypothetical protein [Bacilli bacterium]